MDIMDISILIERAIVEFGWSFKKDDEALVATNKNGDVNRFDYEWEFIGWLVKSF